MLVLAAAWPPVCPRVEPLAPIRKNPTRAQSDPIHPLHTCLYHPSYIHTYALEKYLPRHGVPVKVHLVCPLVWNAHHWPTRKSCHPVDRTGDSCSNLEQPKRTYPSDCLGPCVRLVVRLSPLSACPYTSFPGRLDHLARRLIPALPTGSLAPFARLGSPLFKVP